MISQGRNPDFSFNLRVKILIYLYNKIIASCVQTSQLLTVQSGDEKLTSLYAAHDYFIIPCY